MTRTSASLLERLRRPGDEAAWARFVQLYTPLIYYWGRRAGLQAEDAADLVQDVMTTLVRKMPGFVYDPGHSFRSWLRALTLNKWRDRCKQRVEAPLGNGATAAFEPSAPGPDEVFAEEEYRALLVRRALQIMQADFQPQTWKACWEHVVAGRPAAEVGAELGLTVGAVYAAKFRVLERLRQELSGLDV
jgi:RNA polymerase sigma-70 factor (ECF subfamily)